MFLYSFSMAAAFDANPHCWSALRVLIEWARTVRIVKSCGSEQLMSVISFCHLFINFATKSPPILSTSDAKPYTLKRIGLWMESANKSECGSLVYDFLAFIADRTNREWLGTKVDPLTGDPLIKSDFIDELCTHAEHALILLAVHEGDIRKLFQFCTKKRLFRLDKRYIDPKNASEGRKTQCLKEIKMMCRKRNDNNLLFELLERNGIFYVEVNGDHKDMLNVERAILNIHNRVVNTLIRGGTLRYNTFHVANSTFIIPEYAHGPSTEVSFVTYEGKLFTARHSGMWKSRLVTRNGDPNHDWRQTEYSRYETQFLNQIRLFREKKQLDVRESRIRRFFGTILCNIRVGNHYFFNVPETLYNSFESLNLRTVEEKVAHLEETLMLEKEANIIGDMKDSLTLIKKQYSGG